MSDTQQAPNAASDVEMSQYVADRQRVDEEKLKKDDEIIQQFGDYTYGWHDSDAAGEADLSGFNADDFKYYVKPIDKQAKTWEELPDDIRSTYDRLGIPEAEKSRLVSGVAAQYESEVIYNSIQKDLADQGVIFVDTDTAVREYPDLVRGLAARRHRRDHRREACARALHHRAELVEQRLQPRHPARLRARGRHDGMG